MCGNCYKFSSLSQASSLGGGRETRGVEQTALNRTLSDICFRPRKWATMVNFQCAHCERTYKHRKSLLKHMKSKHPNVIIEKRTRGAGKNVGSSQYKCHHCGGDFSKRSNLDRHGRSVHTTAPAFNCTRCGKGCTRSLNLEMHMRTCTGAVVALFPPPVPPLQLIGVELHLQYGEDGERLGVLLKCIPWIFYAFLSRYVDNPRRVN